MSDENSPQGPAGMAARPRRKTPKGQPSGLWVLFATEMWERFSYYGMRALLVFYLVAKTSGQNGGFGWSEETASQFYGWYTGLVYLTPLIGGWLADKVLGTHRSMLVGGWIIAAGHFCLAFTEFFASSDVETVTFYSAPAPFLTFMTGLVLIIIGTGFFKPCVSVMVGQLYSEDDPRRDSGFTIFYMGINVGAALSGLVAGTLGEKVGWHWGFGSAGVGMILGLAVYQVFRPMFLKGIGLPPHHAPEHEEGHEPTPEEVHQAEIDEYERTRPLTRIDWHRMAVVLILAVLAIVFWIAFEQAGSSLNLVALNQTDREVADYEFPATWYQSVNPVAIILFAPLFALLWIWLDRRGWQPSTPVKFAIGLMFLSAGYVVMIFGALQAGSPMEVTMEKLPDAAKATVAEHAGNVGIEKIEALTWDHSTFFDVQWTVEKRPVRILVDPGGRLLRKQTTAADGSVRSESAAGFEKVGLAQPHWLLLLYVMMTWGELCLSPVGLSMVTKLSPARYTSLMMGLYFGTYFFANLAAGYLAAFSTKIAAGEVCTLIGGQADFVLLLAVVPAIVGLVVLAISPVIKKMMHGLH